jgi:hypothetical protein
MFLLNRNRSARHRFLPALLPLLSAALLGCGQPTGDVSGAVAYKNKPLAYGWVRLMGSDGIPHDGMIQPDGTYRVKGVPVGLAKVMVTSIEPKGGKIAKRPTRPARDGPVRDAKPSAPPDIQKYSQIPLHYSDIWKSTLSVTVQKGTNALAIELK